MVNIAILVGNSQYRFLNELVCCRDDLLAMQELLQASEKYENVEIIENADSDVLKSQLRAIFDRQDGVDELLFYFTGHGCQLEDDFYFCSTNFDSKRPNETGLSNTELHTLLKLANANLVVKIVDACNSGTLLLKADIGFVSPQKHGFKNLIQISSCLDSQNSLTGDPLSLFTEKFRSAALRKLEGPVYFTDIVNVLRDEFLQNNAQTPFFVSQATGRELFIDNATRFDALRVKIAEAMAVDGRNNDAVEDALPATPTLALLLHKAEERIATVDRVSHFTTKFFDALSQKISDSDFSEFFDAETVVHSSFLEPTTEAFIIRVLSKEKRPDNFVTAVISREKQPATTPWSTSTSLALLRLMGTDQQYIDTYDLSLNCSVQKIQMKITLTPRFKSLKRMALVITCAPSLTNCYIFEIMTEHLLKDFNEFDSEGNEIVRRWYKLDWSDAADGIVRKITDQLNETVQLQLEKTRTWLADDQK